LAEGAAEGAPLPPVAGSFTLGPGRRQPQQGKGQGRRGQPGEPARWRPVEGESDGVGEVLRASAAACGAEQPSRERGARRWSHVECILGFLRGLQDTAVVLGYEVM
jgi:hypothetical protein